MRENELRMNLGGENDEWIKIKRGDEEGINLEEINEGWMKIKWRDDEW